MRPREFVAKVFDLVAEGEFGVIEETLYHLDAKDLALITRWINAMPEWSETWKQS